MKSIVRIEHSDSGIGIFQHRSDEFEIDAALPTLNRRHNTNFPSLWGDSFTFFNYIADDEPSRFDCYCAFLSIEQLQEWVTPGELQILIKKYNFKILSIDVNKWGESEHQIIFESDCIVNLKYIK